MKLNTKLGIVKQKAPLEVVLLEDVRRLDALEAQVAALMGKTEKPQEEVRAEETPPKPEAFALDVRRREDGLIKEIKARDASTGLLYYTFDVARDSHGVVSGVVAKLNKNEIGGVV